MKKSEYEQELFEAYIGTPEKFDWYTQAFEYFEQRENRMSWYWSIWAMIGGFWYLIYRKQMKMAMIVLFVSIFLGAILPMGLLPFVMLLFAIAMGGFGTYFVYAQYRTKREELEAVLDDEEKRILIMKYKIGGVNRLAIPMAIIMLISLISIVIGLAVMSGRVVL
ncbi:MAG: hypothetical protein U9R27_03035 [Campylobacterota bacterium]|nr:hypothetical protein [Campylobacterota bacterium]